MSHLAEQISLEIQRGPVKRQRLMEMTVLLLIEQVRLLEENATNRQKALSQWQPTNSSPTATAKPI